MRGINTWLWPYMAIAMYNELDKVCIACEAIMLSERALAYTFLVSFLFKHAPGRSPDQVLVVSGDGFFSQAMLRDPGFPNARYLRDWYHLFNTELQDMFGKVAFCMIKRELSLMIRASSESFFFDKAHENAQTLLKRMGERSAEAEKTLDTFALVKHEYAQFCIDTMPGSRGKHGSSNSKINHSSVLCYMNDGHK